MHLIPSFSDIKTIFINSLVILLLLLLHKYYHYYYFFLNCSRLAWPGTCTFLIVCSRSVLLHRYHLLDIIIVLFYIFKENVCWMRTSIYVYNSFVRGANKETNRRQLLNDITPLSCIYILLTSAITVSSSDLCVFNLSSKHRIGIVAFTL